MKIVFILTACILSFILFSACRLHSILDFENKEVPSSAKPKELSQDIIRKYSVGQVLVFPLLQRADFDQSLYILRVDFFSKNPVKITLKDVLVTVDGKQIPYGQELIHKDFSYFKYYKEYECYYLYVQGSILKNIKLDENTKNIEVSLAVVVTDKKNKIDGTIKATFLPRKRTYLE